MSKRKGARRSGPRPSSNVVPFEEEDESQFVGLLKVEAVRSWAATSLRRTSPPSLPARAAWRRR